MPCDLYSQNWVIRLQSSFFVPHDLHIHTSCNVTYWDEIDNSLYKGSMTEWVLVDCFFVVYVILDFGNRSIKINGAWSCEREIQCFNLLNLNLANFGHRFAIFVSLNWWWCVGGCWASKPLHVFASLQHIGISIFKSKYYKIRQIEIKNFTFYSFHDKIISNDPSPTLNPQSLYVGCLA